MARRVDTDIVSRLRAGDGAAFAELDRRHRRALIAYARRLLRAEHDAEDVVQDALVSAHRALTTGTAVHDLKPWLHALVRNRAIDETRRRKHDHVPAGEYVAERGDEGTGDPAVILTRKETVRRLVEDIAELPEQQRVALLMREVDGIRAEAVGTELGVSTEAAQMLVARARGSLVRARSARDADCPDVREQLALAHERGVRAPEHALRHTRSCDACRSYRKGLRRVDRRLQALTPPIWLVPAVVATKLTGGSGGGKALAGATVAVLAVAGTGLVVLERDTVKEGEATPLRLLGAGAATGKRIELGDELPKGTAITFAKVELPAGAPGKLGTRTLRLTCPGRMRAVGLAVPDRELGLPYAFTPPPDGRTRFVVVRFEDDILAKPLRTRLGIVCKQPDAQGSVIANPRRAGAGETAGRICSDQENILRSPGRIYLGSVGFGDQVVVRRRSDSGAWTRITTEFRLTGWVRTAALCDTP